MIEQQKWRKKRENGCARNGMKMVEKKRVNVRGIEDSVGNE